MASEAVRFNGFFVEGQLGREALRTVEGLGCSVFDRGWEEMPLGACEGTCFCTAFASMVAA